MKTNVNLWWILTGFFLLLTAVYTGWNIIEHSSKPWYNAIEWVGTIALLFSAAMSVMIGFYVNRVHRAQGGELPEDTLTADIDDGDPEIGEFSPWSWWPLVLAFSAALGMIGLAVGYFLLPIAGAVFLVAIVGWVYEYYRGYFAR
ncbi:cytochrome c oxidase subunit 4 [Microbacterium lacticum]|uniref:cytochrome c oxidase subunit 4 n=1 Tax=Microbacterium lacticum TaxID=33885 RepID=UPI00242F4B04|nr:cytochrome c oxidase subunit 4 [Microbacterium lacticum]